MHLNKTARVVIGAQFGDGIRGIIERNLGLFAAISALFIVGGFVLVKYVV